MKSFIAVGVARVLGGAHVQSKDLVLMFDKNDVVSKFSMRESEQDVTRGTTH